MEIEGHKTQSNWLPDTYVSSGGHKARAHFRDVGRILQEKPELQNAQLRRAKQTGAKEISATARARFSKIWNSLNTGQSTEDADVEYEKLKRILPMINSLNIPILAVAAKYIPFLPSVESEKFIPDFKGYVDDIYSDVMSATQMKKDPQPTREGIGNDVLRYVKLIQNFSS